MHTITIIIVSVIKRGERVITAAFQIISAVLIIKNKSPILFLDLSHDHSCLTESMLHCWHQSYYKANRISGECMRYIAVVCGHELKCLRSDSICYRTAPRDFSPFRVIKLLRAVLCLHTSICYFMRSAKTRQPIPSGILSYNSYEQKKKQQVNKHTVLLTLRLQFLVKEFFTSIRSGWGIHFLLLIPAAAAWCGFWSASLFFKQSAPWVNFL